MQESRRRNPTASSSGLRGMPRTILQLRFTAAEGECAQTDEHQDADQSCELDVPFGEFPHILWPDVYLARPYKRPVPNKHLIEERLVFQPPPIGFVKVSRTVKDGLVASIELDSDPVAIQRLRRHYVMQRFHRSFSAAGQS